tara:strand:- start:29070 stop:29528 length:459 start_codon:yes stop_codon:yes gene_type:complete
MFKKKEIVYGHEAFEEGIEKIYNNIMAVGSPYSRIIGLSRGGLIPAVFLSHKLDIPVTPLVWSTRDSGEKEIVEWIPEDLNNGAKYLIIDDIVDSGQTIKTLFESWGDFPKDNISIASLIYNSDQELMVDFFDLSIQRSKEKSWYKFWWEDK